MEPFLEALKHRVLVGDGAYGTLLASRGLVIGGGVGPILNVAKPNFVLSAHQEYLDAGADVIETNTFGADPLALASAEAKATSHEVCRAGAALARQAANGKAYVLGAIGPLFRSSVKLTDDERSDCIAQQVAGLLEGGVDAILLETFPDLSELLFAIHAVREAALYGQLVPAEQIVVVQIMRPNSCPLRFLRAHERL